MLSNRIGVGFGNSRWIALAALLLAGLCGRRPAYAQTTQVVLSRNGSTIVFEPYAPNIIRVTLSKSKEQATAPPGYGFVASPSAQDWTREDSASGTTYRSSRMVVSLEALHPGKPLQSQIDISKFFVGSAPPAHIDFTPRREKLSSKWRVGRCLCLTTRMGTQTSSMTSALQTCHLSGRRDVPFS